MNCPQCKAVLDDSLSSVQNCNYCHTLLVHVNNEVSSIKCKGCYAPLKLEGELNRSKVLICHYCNTAMDSENEFKELYVFKNIQEPNTALEVGMQGFIEGTEYTIVSLIVYRSRGTEWLDFTLYSKTEGYVKLIKKEGKYLFFNKSFKKIEENIWLLRKSETFEIEHENFIIDAFYFTEIYFALGSIDAKINQNQRNKQCFAKSDTSWFYSRYSLEDVVYYLGSELDEVEELFRFIIKD